eukprot:8321366-Alexandrium_andersonii.AAC.1
MKYFHAVRRCIQHLSCGSERCKQASIEHLPVIAAATPYESKLTRRRQVTYARSAGLPPAH